MAAKKKPDQKLVVESLWLARDGNEGNGRCERISAQLEGLEGDRHGGFIKPADARDSGIARGTPVRNWRQWSAVSVEDLRVIAQNMSVPYILPDWLSANVCFSGMDDFTKIAAGANIIFPSGAILHVEGENAPCVGPGRKIQENFKQASAGLFPKAAMGLRGIVGVVYCAGEITVGDTALIRYE